MSNYFTDYDVVTEDEALNLLPAGKYEAWIRRAEVKQSKTDPSKRHVILTVDVYDANGMPHTIVQGCYLKHLLRHACKAAGCLEQYESKTLVLDEHLKGKEVVAIVGRDEAKDGYRAKNTIKDYEPAVKAEVTESLNDALPF